MDLARGLDRGSRERLTVAVPHLRVELPQAREPDMECLHCQYPVQACEICPPGQCSAKGWEHVYQGTHACPAPAGERATYAEPLVPERSDTGMRQR
jgi:hypothetical protein